MQINTKRIGMVEAMGQNLVIFTPDECTNPSWDLGDLSVQFVVGSPNITIRTNCRGDSSANLVGVEAISFVHEALGEVIRRMKTVEVLKHTGDGY
jgi:hypothetical protein